jgi:competence protein ComEC
MQNSKIVFRKFFLGFFLAITIFVWYGVWAEERNGLMTVAFLDIGQGDAIFIEAPNGKQVLIDAGPNRQVLRELSRQMVFYDRSIDIAIATHPDSDHIGGFPAVLETYAVDTMLVSGVECKSSICEKLDRLVEERKINELNVTRGTIIDLGGGVFLEVLFPDRDAANFENNLSSLVIKLIYGNNSFLLTGDSPKEIEEYLVSLDATNLDVDVLKLGHHGSKTSTTNSFLGFTSPEVAIISAGKDNRYGHPHQEVLDILEEFEVKVLRTDEDGTIVIKSDGSNLIY